MTESPTPSGRPNEDEIILAHDELCRRDFHTFASMAFDLVSPEPLIPGWHVQALTFQLGKIIRGESKRLMVNMPPRFGKSYFASVALPAYLLGQGPRKRILVISHNGDLAVQLHNSFRQLVESEQYARLYPDFQISAIKNTENIIQTTAGGYRLACSILAVPAGFGADLIIIDDPHRPGDVFSDRKRKRVNDEYFRTIIHRLNNKMSGAVVIVMQRLHPEDLCGHLLKRPGDYDVLKLAAIAERDERIQLGEHEFYERRAGEVLHPALLNETALAQLKAQSGALLFAAQYQQCPVLPDGEIVKRAWIKRYDHAPVRNASAYVVQSWDTALKHGDTNDYSACVTALIMDGNVIILDDFRDRLDFEALRERAIRLARTHNPVRILVEDSGVGIPLAAALKQAGLRVVAIRPEGPKLQRLIKHLDVIEAGRLFLPREAPWLAEFEEELFGFPNTPNDDQVDALVQVLGDLGNHPNLWTPKATENYAKFVEAVVADREFARRAGRPY